MFHKCKKSKLTKKWFSVLCYAYILKAKQLAEFTFWGQKIGGKNYVNCDNKILWRMWENHEHLITCFLKILAMIDHDQEKFGIAVSGESENLLGFAFWA